MHNNMIICELIDAYRITCFRINPCKDKISNKKRIVLYNLGTLVLDLRSQATFCTRLIAISAHMKIFWVHKLQVIIPCEKWSGHARLIDTQLMQKLVKNIRTYIAIPRS